MVGKQRKKKFDCVEMMHRGAAHVQRHLKGMTREEQLAYWQESYERMCKLQEELRKKARGS